MKKPSLATSFQCNSLKKSKVFREKIYNSTEDFMEKAVDMKNRSAQQGFITVD